MRFSIASIRPITVAGTSTGQADRMTSAALFDASFNSSNLLRGRFDQLLKSINPPSDEAGSCRAAHAAELAAAGPLVLCSFGHIMPIGPQNN